MCRANPRYARAISKSFARSPGSCGRSAVRTQRSAWRWYWLLSIMGDLWLAGAGIEWAFGHNWTVKLEYDYLGLSDRTVFTPQTSFLAGDIFTNTGNNGNNNIQMVKLGINYLFNWGSPVVARY